MVCRFVVVLLLALFAHGCATLPRPTEVPAGTTVYAAGESGTTHRVDVLPGATVRNYTMDGREYFCTNGDAHANNPHVIPCPTLEALLFDAADDMWDFTAKWGTEVTESIFVTDNSPLFKSSCMTAGSHSEENDTRSSAPHPCWVDDPKTNVVSFLHTHPGNTGPSGQDIRVCAQGLRRCYVVTVRWVYEITGESSEAAHLRRALRQPRGRDGKYPLPKWQDATKCSVEMSKKHFAVYLVTCDGGPIEYEYARIRRAFEK